MVTKNTFLKGARSFSVGVFLHGRGMHGKMVHLLAAALGSIWAWLHLGLPDVVFIHKHAHCLATTLGISNLANISKDSNFRRCSSKHSLPIGLYSCRTLGGI